MNCYGALEGLLTSVDSLEDEGNIRLVALYDNEEVSEHTPCISAVVTSLPVSVFVCSEEDAFAHRSGTGINPHCKFHHTMVSLKYFCSSKQTWLCHTNAGTHTNMFAHMFFFFSCKCYNSSPFLTFAYQGRVGECSRSCFFMDTTRVEKAVSGWVNLYP